MYIKLTDVNNKDYTINKHMIGILTQEFPHVCKVHVGGIGNIFVYGTLEELVKKWNLYEASLIKGI